MARRAKKRDAREVEPGPAVMSLANHPVASEQIRFAKGIGGLLALAVLGWASWRSGAPLLTVGAHALAAGLAGYALAWALTLAVWRHIAIADIQRKREEAEQAQLAYLAEQQTASAAPAGAPAG